MATWSGCNFLDALETLLEAREGLDDVQVDTFDPGDELTKDDAIIIYEIEGQQEPFAFAKKRLDRYVARGYVEAKRAGAGDVVTAARNQAETILAELETCLRGDQTVSGTVTYAQLTNISLKQYPTADRSRMARIDFEIGVLAASL